MGKRIYLDYSATTPVKKEVLDVMMPYFTEDFGNPSSVHSFGRDAKNAVNGARETVAKYIGAIPAEVYFTGGGSESDNWAIRGVAYANAKKGKHIITSKVEHHAVLHTCEQLEKEGFEVTYLDVNEFGEISLEELKKAIKPETILITIMYANNEIGTIEPIKEIGEIAKEKGVIFHTDAVQALGNIKIDVKELNIDTYWWRIDEEGGLRIALSEIKTDVSIYPTAEWDYGVDRFTRLGLKTGPDDYIINSFYFIFSILHFFR